MEAIILAGGFGTRLKSVVSDVPKPMAPIQNKPFLAYLLTFLAKHGISKFVLSVGYMNEKIVDYFGQSFLSVPISYVIENKALGTGGAIKLALKKVKTDNVLVYNGDTFFDIDPRKLFSFHKNTKAEISLALKNLKKPARYGTIKLQGSRVIGFSEKNKNLSEGLINCGVYCLSRHIFEGLIMQIKFSFEKDFLENYFHKKMISGMVHSGYFIDIGIPEDYEKAQSELTQYTI